MEVDLARGGDGHVHRFRARNRRLEAGQQRVVVRIRARIELRIRHRGDASIDEGAQGHDLVHEFVRVAGTSGGRARCPRRALRRSMRSAHEGRRARLAAMGRDSRVRRMSHSVRAGRVRRSHVPLRLRRFCRRASSRRTATPSVGRRGRAAPASAMGRAALPCFGRSSISLPGAPPCEPDQERTSRQKARCADRFGHDDRRRRNVPQHRIRADRLACDDDFGGFVRARRIEDEHAEMPIVRRRVTGGRIRVSSESRPEARSF